MLASLVLSPLISGFTLPAAAPARSLTAARRFDGISMDMFEPPTASDTLRVKYAKDKRRMGGLAAFAMYREELVDAWNAVDEDGDDKIASAEELGAVMEKLGEPLEETVLNNLWETASEGKDKLEWVKFTKAWCDSATAADDSGGKKFFGLF